MKSSEHKLNASKEDLELIISSVDHSDPLNERVLSVSKSFLELPYHADSLIGGPETDEELVVRCDGFDCVTFVELVFAIACSKDVDDLYNRLKKIRYEKGLVSWASRNHYMTDWILRNSKEGLCEDVTPNEGQKPCERTLSLIPEYPAHSRTINFLPVEILKAQVSELKSGDIILFGTTRENLDYAHLGFLIVERDRLSVRHAAKSIGKVLDEPLDSFMERFGDSPGVTIVRLKHS